MSTITELSISDAVVMFGKELLKSDIEKLELPLRHFYADGLYCRVMYAPKGAIIVGKKHLKDSINFIMHGRIRVGDEETGYQILQAPDILVSKSGSQKIGYVEENCIWASVHLNPFNLDEKDLENDLTFDNVGVKE